MINIQSSTDILIELGIQQNLIEIKDDRIIYKNTDKSYKFTDPEEIIRATYYIELITKYKYSENRISFEVVVPRREPSDKADIVVYEDDEKQIPYLVVECKKDGISQSEIKQAIEQAFGNANSLRSKFTVLVSGDIRIAFDVTNFAPQEREKNIIADIPERYGQIIKYRFKKNDTHDLQIITKDSLLKKFQQCHDTLWEGGRRNPAEAFDEMSKLMFCKIHDERFLTGKNQYYNFQIGTYESITEVAKRIKKIYDDAHKRDQQVFEETIKVDDSVLFSVVEILQGISLSKTDLDSKGVAFEHFLGSVFRGEMGQYFTPRQIVEIMVDFVEPTEDDWIIDPACGSGGFLIHSMEKVRTRLKEKLEIKDANDRWFDFAKYQLFGIEINSQLSRVAMMNMILHEDGHTNIETNDALDKPTNFDPRRNIQLGKFSLLLTNPPFGAEVKEREKQYLKSFFLGSKEEKRVRQKTEILFIERCLDFLKPEGRMGIILPDSILVNSSIEYVREFIFKKAKILGIVSLPEGTFSHYGAGVKASMVFLRKLNDGEKIEKDYPIFMSISEHIGYDATGRPDKNDLPLILEAWKKFKKNNW